MGEILKSLMSFEQLTGMILSLKIIEALATLLEHIHF
jgi:hypothetical protein